MRGPERIVVIDDNEVDREAVKRLVGREFVVDEAATAQEGLRLVLDQRPDCVLLDYRLPDGSGVDLVGTFAEEGLPVVMLSGVGSESVAVAALKRGAQDYLVKDRLSADGLRIAVRSAIHEVELRRRLDDQQRAIQHHANALARQTEQLRILLDQLPALVWTTDRDLRVTAVSGHAPAGLVLAPDVPVADVLEGFLAAHRAALAGDSSRIEARVGEAVAECVVQPLRDAVGATVGTLGLLLDVTEHRRLEAQLRHSQRMEAMGQLAGGVAHDFNNLLTVVLNSAELARGTLPAGHAAVEDLDDVVSAAMRAAELTRQLLAFARRQPSRPVTVSVSKTVSEVTRLLSRLLGEHVELRTVLTDEGPVRIDPGSLEQVVVNLAVNARDAMERGGRLVLEVAEVEVPEGWTDAQGAPIPPGPYVRLVVEDTGAGIAPEVRARIFEPFFTTKPSGVGTGLGLATVFGIVSQAGGAVRVESEPGRGTAFQVYLPRTDPAEAGDPPPPARPARGTETVLVVEDDAQVRSLVTRVLTAAGYRTIPAASGEEALRLLGDPAVAPDVMLTDVVMPGISGFELVDLVRERRPGLPVVLASGYAPEARREDLEGTEVLGKPFSPADLTDALRRALARTPALKQE